MIWNQDTSWIHFNARVLQQAVDQRTPLLERVRFLQIFSTNLDEFFMKRIGRAHPDVVPLIRPMIAPLLTQLENCWTQQIVPQLAQHGIHFLEWDELTPAEQMEMETFFDTNVFPVLTPLSIGPGLPFPFLSNLSASLGLFITETHVKGDTEEHERIFTRVKIPPIFPQWIPLNSGPVATTGRRFLSFKTLIRTFIVKLFPGMDTSTLMSFRVTRNTIVESEDEDVEDLLESVADELRERRFGEVVRLELDATTDDDIEELLKSELNVGAHEIYRTKLEIDFSKLGALTELDLPQLKYRPWRPVTPEVLRHQEKSFFEVIRERDVLVHHPYESFSESVENFVRTAANDPHVLAIKMTLYRTGANSPFIPILIRAAESGKQVVCLVELKARFDEERNILVAQALEEAGVHVVYGIPGLKTHCKVTLVVRQDEDQIRSYAHIGTGNYHATTSKLYTDFGLFTASPQITEDVIHLFHFLTGRSVKHRYKRLLIAPIQMKERFIQLIQKEAAHARNQKPARIIAKMNNLEDAEIIQALYEASQAGVKIDLIVRGFCCLAPQVPGLSENIRVISVIGRFLEHCRVFFFQNGAKNPMSSLFLIGSADWMCRNMDSRIEAVTPIADRALKKRLWDHLNILLDDQRSAWDLTAQGTYQQRTPAAPDADGTHEIQMKLYQGLLKWSAPKPKRKSLKPQLV